MQARFRQFSNRLSSRDSPTVLLPGKGNPSTRSEQTVKKVRPAKRGSQSIWEVGFLKPDDFFFLAVSNETWSPLGILSSPCCLRDNTEMNPEIFILGLDFYKLLFELIYKYSGNIHIHNVTFSP